MEFIVSEEFAKIFFIIGTIIVTAIVWRGYRTGKFSPWFGWLTVLVFIGYATAFLWRHYLTGEMGEHSTREASYAIFASIHGTISLWAIIQASVMFALAERSFNKGINYFTVHKKSSIVLLILWPLALLSGFLMG